MIRKQETQVQAPVLAILRRGLDLVSRGAPADVTGAAPGGIEGMKGGRKETKQLLRMCVLVNCCDITPHSPAVKRFEGRQGPRAEGSRQRVSPQGGHLVSVVAPHPDTLDQHLRSRVPSEHGVTRFHWLLCGVLFVGLPRPSPHKACSWLLLLAFVLFLSESDLRKGEGETRATSYI